MPPAGAKIQIPSRWWEELADQPLQGTLLGLVDRLAELQNEFEESLLDQELWTSVDLLQNVGIQHHQVFGGLSAKIREPGIGTDELKEFLREGRVAFSEWLFNRFKYISAQASSVKGAERAFERLFDRLDEVCRSLPLAPVAVAQHENRLVSSPEDQGKVRAGKGLKRMLRGLGKGRFERSFSLQRLAYYHLLGRLSERLLGIAQMLGEAEFFLLRRVKGLSEEIDRAYTSFLGLLDRVEKQPDIEALEHRALALGVELDENFRLIGAEVMRYYDDIRVALEREVRKVAEDLVRDAGRAGTVEMPERRFRLARGEVARHRRQITERLERWGRYQAGFTGAYTMGLEMVRVQNRLRHAVDETVLEVNGRLRQRLEEQYLAVKQHLERSVAMLREVRAREISVEEVRGQIEKERDNLLDFLGKEEKQILQTIAASGEINQLFDLLVERFRRLADQTVEIFNIIEEDDLPTREGQVPDPVELQVAPVRGVVRAYLEGVLTHRLGDVNRAMLGQVEELETAVEELGQSASFSLGNVAIELREVGKKPGELIPVALGRLQRGLEGFQECFRKVEESNRETQERVVREVADTARLLRQQVLEETVREMRRKIDSQKGRWGLRRWKSGRGHPPRLRGEFAGEGRMPAPVPVEKEGPVEEAGKAETLDYEGILDLEVELAARVPFAYQRLFRTTPLEVSASLAGRSGALGVVEAACQRWRQSRFSAVVISGEQGSGKTSLVNCAMELKLRGLPLVRHRLEDLLLEEEELVLLLNRLLDMPGKSLDDLEERITQSHERRVVVLEDLHRLHLRAMHGLELLPRFLAFIDITGTHILWLVSIEYYAWQYLEKVLQISRHFAFRIETGHLSRQELEGAIMTRHRATGYRLRFVGESQEKEGDQEGLRQDFFDQLHRACGGNVFAAIFYWLRSVAGVEGNVLAVKPLEELKLEFLQALPLPDLLSLAMLVEHGNLSAADFGAIFRIPRREGQARLIHLERQGILKRTRKDNRVEVFSINPILYHPIVDQMRRRNLLP